MKTTIIILMILMAGIVTAFVSFDNVKTKTYIEKVFPNETIDGIKKSDITFNSHHTAFVFKKNKKEYTVYMSEKDYEEKVLKK